MLTMDKLEELGSACSFYLKKQTMIGAGVRQSCLEKHVTLRRKDARGKRVPGEENKPQKQIMIRNEPILNFLLSN